jgi:hypothetical protein
MANDYASIHAHYSATYRYLEICQRKLTAPQPLLDTRGRNRQGSQSTPTPLACILCAHCSCRSLSFTATRLGPSAWGFSLLFLFLFRLWLVYYPRFRLGGYQRGVPGVLGSSLQSLGSQHVKQFPRSSLFFPDMR